MYRITGLLVGNRQDRADTTEVRTMEKYFTGKELKEKSKAKTFRDICIRFRQRSVSIEFQEKENGAYVSEYVTDYDNKRPHNMRYSNRNDWVLLYANQIDHEWQFFVNALKPADEIVFYERENGNQYTKESKFAVLQLMARITSRKRNGQLSAIHETVLDTRITKIENLDC